MSQLPDDHPTKELWTAFDEGAREIEGMSALDESRVATCMSAPDVAMRRMLEERRRRLDSQSRLTKIVIPTTIRERAVSLNQAYKERLEENERLFRDRDVAMARGDAAEVAAIDKDIRRNGLKGAFAGFSADNLVLCSVMSNATHAVHVAASRAVDFIMGKVDSAVQDDLLSDRRRYAARRLALAGAQAA